MTTARSLIQSRFARVLAGKLSAAGIRQHADVVYANRPLCGAFARSAGRPCEVPCWVRADGTIAPRCKLHGGKSTGPKTQAGKDRAEMARVVGYYNWLERKRRIEAALGRDFARRLIAEHGAIPPAILRALRANGVL